MQVLRTERLVLRWLTLEDADFIRELVNDADWIRYIGDRGVRTVEDARRYLADGPIAMYARHGFGLYRVELRESGVPIGICGLIKRDWLEDVDVGFALLPGFRSRGYAYEAAEATLRYGRQTLGLSRIVAVVSPRNEISKRLLERLGLRFERMARLGPESPETCLFGPADARHSAPLAEGEAAKS
jgi:RimJ/RimL family protein N-acetyltransferase